MGQGQIFNQGPNFWSRSNFFGQGQILGQGQMLGQGQILGLLGLGQILGRGRVQDHGRGQCVCVWLHLASPDVSVDSADGASSQRRRPGPEFGGRNNFSWTKISELRFFPRKMSIFTQKISDDLF